MFGDAWSGATNNFSKLAPTENIHSLALLLLLPHPKEEGRCTDLHDLSGNGRLEGCIVVGKVRESMLVTNRC